MDHHHSASGVFSARENIMGRAGYSVQTRPHTSLQMVTDFPRIVAFCESVPHQQKARHKGRALGMSFAGALLAQFEARETNQRQNERDDPEPDNHLTFGPAVMFEV